MNLIDFGIGADRPGPSPTVGLITGSGTYALPSLTDPTTTLVATEFGVTEVTAGELCGVQVAHISRHGDGHPRLSHQVDHRANVAALRELEVDSVIALTICGAVDPDLELGGLVAFDDLYFPANRLPNGEACTMFTEPGDPDRAHWIFDRPFSEQAHAAIVEAVGDSGFELRSGGCYGHVDGPRFNTRAEVRALAMTGVTAISQTAGPEAVLCGESGIPYALLGYVTDYANGVGPDPTTLDELMANMASSADVFGVLIEPLVSAVAARVAKGAGVNYGFESRPDLYTSAGRQRTLRSAAGSI